jgi:uncharacterized protein with von Willebrand factor type A (vWA) domain
MLIARDLTRAMLAFGATLRLHGLPVTTGALMDAVRALGLVNVMDRNDVYLALRALLMSRVEEQPIFDECFQEFWKLRDDHAAMLQQIVVPADTVNASEHAEPQTLDNIKMKRSDMAAMGIEDSDAPGAESFDVPGESDIEILAEQDFATFSTEQLDEVARAAVQIAKRLARRLNRRRKPTRRRGAINLRRSIRANLMRGEIIELRRQARRRRKVRLVLLCDVSGSMDLYSRFLLQFLYSLQNVFGHVETFTFATRLTRVSDLLRGPSYKSALSRLAAVRDWSGGTRIGEALREFNEHWGRLADHRTIVVLLSDGWDTGSPELLAQELLTIKRRAGRVIWLNPLLGNPTYEPLTRGMAAALPLVHHFAPAHNLDSLRALARYLSLR